MIGLLLTLAMATHAPGIAAFKAEFPTAATEASPSGALLVQASDFSATGLGSSPELAARAFLGKHGVAFGVRPRHVLHLINAPAAGQPGAVRFERRLRGFPIFEGDVTVGVDAANAVMLVNATDVPSAIAGVARLGEVAAIEAARKAAAGAAGEVRAQRGWYRVGEAVRPAWRVELAGSRWFVDAVTGGLLASKGTRSPGPRGPKPPSLEGPKQ